MISNDRVINAEDLARKPELLFSAFERIVGLYRNGGMRGVDVDVPALLAWEKAADVALKALSLEDLKRVYDHYQRQDLMQDRGDIFRVIQKEIESICAINAELEPHLKFGSRMDETCCDAGIQHLVANYGRYIGNLGEAFERAFALKAEASCPAVGRGISPEGPKGPSQ